MIHEECGVIGFYNVENASEHAYLGLYALQHRGQESAGIATSDGENIQIYKNMGLVSEVFKNGSYKDLPGSSAIGHNRYSTTGDSEILNAQPILINYKSGSLAIAHNGNIINAREIRKDLENMGAIFQTTSDSEVILHLISRSKVRNTTKRILNALKPVKGAYSLVFLTPNELIAARDPWGFRPLCLGKIGDGYVVSSESCSFDIIGAEYLREIEPGEIITIDKKGGSSIFLPKTEKKSRCIFEYIYFSRPDSIIFGENCDKVRRAFGKKLAEEAPCGDADIVISVPDSSNTHALGYAEASGIKFEIGLIRNHYVGRTFIRPTAVMRESDVRIKFNTVKGVLRGKKVVLIDDSLVRGTTLKKLVKLVREGGASEVHVRVSSPPIISPCFFGIDMPTKEELRASSKSVKEIEKIIGADSLQYLSIEGLLSCAPPPADSYCTACFGGEYPAEPPKGFRKTMGE